MRKIFLLLATLLILTSSVDAAKVDMYRDALLNKSFTLKYEVVEVPIVETSHDATFTGRGLRNKEVKDIFDYLHKGIIVVDGDNRYFEVAHDDYVTTSRNRLMTVSNKNPEGGICHLVKDGETFNFFWNKKDGKRRYFGGYTMFGGKSKSVKANDETKMQLPYQRLVEEYNFGNGLLYDPETRTVSVNLSTAVQEGDLRPVTSAAVALELGDISGMLDDI